MAELPKIAIERLRAQQSGAAAGSHPDANRLSGFVEGGLSEPERAQMLAHLESCAYCREVVSLSLPEEESGAAVVPAIEGVRGWGLGRWRWGAVVAGAVIVAGAVLLLNPKHTSREDTISQVRPSDSIAASSPPPAIADAEKSKSANELARADARSVPSKSTKSSAFTRSPIVSPAAEPSGRRADSDFYSANAATPSVAAESLADESKRDAQSAHVNKNASSKDNTQSANGGVLGSVLESANAHGSGSGVGGGTFKVSPAAPQVARSEQPPTKATEQNARGAPAPVAPPALSDMAKEKDKKAADQTSAANQTVEVRAESTPMELQTARFNAKYISQSALWHLSNGKLLTKAEPGDAWQEASLPGNPVLRALAIQSNEIWAGGEKGVLLHSADGGRTWTLIDGRWSKESAIIALKFQDAQRGELTTSQKERWITSDNGKSWQKR
jgi:hypothetical protein